MNLYKINCLALDNKTCFSELVRAKKVILSDYCMLLVGNHKNIVFATPVERLNWIIKVDPKNFRNRLEER